MTLDALIMLTGAFVAVLPFLGFPNSWDKVLLFIAGTIIIILGVIVRRRSGSRSQTRGNAGTFVENLPSPDSSRQVGGPRDQRS